MVIAILLGLILIGNVYGLVQRKTGQTAFPMFLGVGKAIVVSGSMDPAIKVNDIVLVHQVPQAAYQKGDIVTYKSPNYPVTHRIQTITGQQSSPKVMPMMGQTNRLRQVIFMEK